MAVGPEITQAIHRVTPFGRWQFVDVEFATFDTDVVVPHQLEPSASDQVFYTVVRANGPCNVYETQTEPGTRLNQRNYIVLRVDTAPVKVRLLLYLAKTDAVGLPEFN